MQYRTRKDGRVYPKQGSDEAVEDKVDEIIEEPKEPKELKNLRCVSCDRPTETSVNGIPVCEECWSAM
jgi:hypothetical protein